MVGGGDQAGVKSDDERGRAMDLEVVKAEGGVLWGRWRGRRWRAVCESSYFLHTRDTVAPALAWHRLP